jgi:hypothetical protein
VRRSVGPSVRLSVALLLAACSERWDRALVLDLALSDPMTVNALAEPWHAAGYSVDYRRFYPHLTHADLRRYQVVILLGGRGPEAPSDAVTVGDLALLRAWLDRGGVVVWGYAGDREGFADRWIMNRWLEWVGAGIVVGDYVLTDSTERGALFEPQPRAAPLSESALRRGGFQPFAFGRNHALIVRDQRQALARSTGHAFVRPPGDAPQARPAAPVVAARRVSDGLVIVVSRHALGALGPELRPSTLPAARLEEATGARAYLLALARWTRRPAEWASVPPGERNDTLRLRDPLAPVSFRPPRAAPPPGAEVVEVPVQPGPDRPRALEPPAWMQRQGLRALWGRFPGLGGVPTPFADTRADIDAVVTFLDVGGFNALVSAASAPPQPIADTVVERRERRLEPRGRWRILLERLQTTSFHWIPAIDLRDLDLPVDPAAPDFQGRPTAAWCALDTVLWNEHILPAYRIVAQLAAAHPDLIPAVALDLDGVDGGVGPRGRAGLETGFCETTFRLVLDSMAAGMSAERLAAIAAAAPVARYDSLLETGLLGAYFETLERLVASRAAAVRLEAHRAHPGMMFAFHLSRWPGDWFALGVLRGFAGRTDNPMLLWTRETRPQAALEELRARNIAAVHALAVSPRRILPGDWSRLRGAAFQESDGFWLVSTEDVLAGPRTAAGPLSADSLGRLVRRLSKER